MVLISFDKNVILISSITHYKIKYLGIFFGRLMKWTDIVNICVHKYLIFISRKRIREREQSAVRAQIPSG